MDVHPKQLLLMVVAVIYTKVATQPVSLPNCPTKCGSVTIPFPFGTTNNCSLDNTFLINCNKTSTSTDVPFLPQSNQSVLNISLDGNLRVAWPVASDCYSKNGTQVNQTYYEINMTHFHISPTKNKLIAVGCDTVGVLTAGDSGGKIYITGCVAFCTNRTDIVADKPCSGIGCCEIPIPQANMLTEVAYVSGSGIYKNHSEVHDFNSCGYAFVVENGSYSLTLSDLRKLKEKEFPVLLDWTVGNQTCLEAQKNHSNYACKAGKSICYNSTERSGYLCKCFDGYRGNPYLNNGCRGIIYFSFSFVMIHVHCEINQVGFTKFGLNLPTNLTIFCFVPQFNSLVLPTDLRNVVFPIAFNCFFCLFLFN